MGAISHNDSATKVVGDINTKFGDDVVSVEDSATSAVQKLNTAFGGGQGMETLSAADDAETFVEKLNSNLGEIDTPTGDNTLSILHLSDTHTQTQCLAACKSYAADTDNNISFILHTGDIGGTRYSISPNNVPPILSIWGNHDACDNNSAAFNRDDAAALTALRDINGDNVEWGGDSAKYWYKDVTTEAGKTIRFIALDEYDFSKGGNYQYSVCYTAEQMNWFLDLLYNTPSSYYIVLITHQPLMQSTPSNDDMNDWTAPIPEGKTASWFVGFQSTFPSWLPKIMDAYKKRIAFSGTFPKHVYDDHDSFSVSKDFSGLSASAKFICYLCGHTHFDWCDHLSGYKDGQDNPLYTDQIQLCVTKADKLADNINSPYRDDVDRSETTWTANKVTFDLTRERVTVNRIGSTTLLNGETRDTITFNF